MLEDGRTYATELVQSRKPSEGFMAQWEHELVSACRLSSPLTDQRTIHAAKENSS